MTDPGFERLVASIDAAMARTPRELVDADAAREMKAGDFCNALGSAIGGLLHRGTDRTTLPADVRRWYSTLVVEGDVGNGGFAHAVECSADEWDDAVDGYRMMGDERSADLLERARAAADDDTLEALDREVDRRPWRGVPWGHSTRARWVRAHRDAFRIG